LKTTHPIPAHTPAPPTTHASVLKTTHPIPAHTPAPPTTHASVLKTTHPIPAQTAAPKIMPLVQPEIQNIYNIKIIINNAKISKNIIDKHISNILHHLDSHKYEERNNNNDNDKLYRELTHIVKHTDRHIHRHYDSIVEYYKNILEQRYKQHNLDDVMNRGDKQENDENDEKGEKGEKVEKKGIFEKNDSRLKRSSKIIESMIKLNHYIKVIEYKIQFIKGDTRYNLFQILYSLRKQYQNDMIQMLKYL
jgi:hypothetical protein